MSNEVQIDYEAVEQAAGGFDDAATTFNRVSVALEAAMTILQTTAFIGLVGGAAVQNYLANIKPEVDNVAAICRELSGDLRSTVATHRNADQQTAADFQ
jgi:uncharacterized protein YukE